MTYITRKIDVYSDRAFFVDRFGFRFIVSYYTIVGYIDSNKQFHKTWDGYSNTTVKNHVAKSGYSFSKKEWIALPVETLPCYNGFNLGYYDIVSYADSNRNLNLMTDYKPGRIFQYYPKYSYGF